MFGWMMDFERIVRCWDWRFGNVEYALVLAWCCLSAVVLKRVVESRNAAGLGFDQEESALVGHLTMQTGQVQQCMLASSQLGMESALHRWLLGLFLFQH
jgi:hypothetical protein